MRQINQTASSNSRGKFLGLIFILLIILVLAFLFKMYLSKNHTKTPDATVEAQRQAEAQVRLDHKDFPETTLPDGMPADVPVELGGKVIHNYTVTSPDGRSQATRVYETIKTDTEVIDIFNKWFEVSGWKVVNKSDQDGAKMVAVTKGNQIMQVAVKPAADGTVRQVEVNLTSNPSSN